MSKVKFDFRRIDFDDTDDYESDGTIKKDERRRSDLPKKHLDKVHKKTI